MVFSFDFIVQLITVAKYFHAPLASVYVAEAFNIMADRTTKVAKDIIEK
jgi:hypothetical protein